jgi:hypothetical protein
MLRALLLLVVLANLAFFGWVQGWFEPTWPVPNQGEREPQRVAAQVRPEAIVVLAPKAASAAVSAARAAAAVCLEAGPLNDADIAGAEAALSPLQLPEGAWRREASPPPPVWLVYGGRVVDAAARKFREDDLRRRGLPFEVIDAPPDLAPGLVLSRHATQQEAEAATAAIAASQPASAPLKTLKVVSLPAPPLQHWLRVARADPEQQSRLKALPSAPLAGGFKPCAQRP